jgi:anti-sigma B factor antagonist
VPLSYQIVWRGKLALIYCCGRLVAGETDEFRDVALHAIQTTARVVLHLASVPYIDSTGLGLLAYLCAAARRQAGDLRLVAPSAQLQELLRITMLGQMFHVYLTEEAAVVAFSTGTQGCRESRH